jgi:hypothetical protein
MHDAPRPAVRSPLAARVRLAGLPDLADLAGLPAFPLLVALVVLGGALVAGCGSSAPSGPVGGPVAGALDMHCVGDGGPIVQPVGVCMCPAGIPDPPKLCSAADASATDDAAAADDAAATDDAAADDAGTSLNEYGPTLDNQSGSDDDCKYDVTWTSSPIRANVDVTFTVTAKRRADDDAPETGGDLTPEIFLDPITPGDTARSVSTETPAGSGTYLMGPVRFTKAGTWTVRFHFNELCSDDPADSPHGHIAFFVTVP